MNSFFEFWPCVMAAVIGALIPSSSANWKLRAGIGAVAAALVLLLLRLGAPHIASETEEWPHLLTTLIAIPLIGAVAILFLPRQSPALLKTVTLAVLAADFALSLVLLKVPMSKGWHFQSIHEWIPAFGIRYHVAIDGMSLWLVILTTFSTPLAAIASFGSIKRGIKDLCFAILLMQGAMICSFVALDLFLFYLSFELMLVPMYVMIGIWGGVEKIKAALKFFLYTMFGSVLMLTAILYMVWTYTKITGTPSFDLLALSRVMLPHAGPNTGFRAQDLCFFAFAIACFIKVPMFPVHTWLPDAHVQAPTGGSVILAAIMLKVGTYAYLRFAMGLFPYAATTYCAYLAGFAVMGGILYGALCAWKQDDVKRLVAYSSVAHLGYVMLGLFGSTQSGIAGSILQMVNHGVSTGALFLLVGVIYDRRHTRAIEEFGGLAKVMPVYATLWLIVTFASIGVPGTNGFVGEFMIIMGTYVSPRLGNFRGIDTTLAAAGVILGAVYMLSVTRRMFFGPLTNPKNRRLKDINPREVFVLTPLVILVFAIGFWPSLFLDPMGPSIAAFDDRFRETFEISKNHGDAPPELVTIEDPSFFKGAPAIKKLEAKAEKLAMGVYLALAPLLLLTIGGCGVMLAEAFSRARHDGTDEHSPSGELGLVTALCLIATALAAMGVWFVGPENIAGLDVVKPYLLLDRFTLFFTVTISIGGALTAMLAAGYLPEHGMDRGEFYPLLIFSALGCVILAAAGDLLSLFIGLETMSLGVYALTGFRRTSTKSAEAALKYFLLGSFAAALLLYGGALIYGATGHTDLAGIGKVLANGERALPLPMVLFGFVLILVGLAFKVSAVPFHMWAPDAYEGAPTPAMSFMAVAVKSAAFAMMLRVLLTAFGDERFASWSSGWPPVVALLAVLTMTVANLIAGQQESVKRMLAYSSIAHAGYVLVGVVAAAKAGVTHDAEASVLFYLLAYTVSTAGAVGALVLMGSKGAEAVSFEDLAGVGRRHPAAAMAMSFFLLSLAGVPPLGGFFAKLYVVQGAVKAGYIWLAIFTVINSVISAYYYLRVMVYMYMREPQPGAPQAVPMKSPMVTAALVLSALLVLYFGLTPGSGLSMALRAATGG